MIENYLKILLYNTEQQAAIIAPPKPLRIIAGPGTGKTRTLVGRIEAFIKEHDIPPSRILALTFTNKAAHELTERLQANGQHGVQAMTFHSLAAKLLRRYWQDDFRILTESEQNELLQKILNSAEQKQRAEIVADWEILAERDFCTDGVRSFRSALSEGRLRELLTKYHTALQQENALDFNQLQVRLLSLWRDQPEVLRQCQKLFAAALVDEYQDVSSLQIELVRQLVQPHENITVVGDSDQTIYAWRGARATSMEEFTQLFPEAVTVSLTQNYRNPAAVLRGAQTLIAHNSERQNVELSATKNSETKISLWETRSTAEEIEVVLSLLEKQVGSIAHMHHADELDTDGEEKRSFSEIAILYRTQVQGKVLESALTKQGYPVQRSSGEHFWQRKEVSAFLETLTQLRERGELPAEQKLSQFLAAQIAAVDVPNAQKKRLQQLISVAVAFDDLPFAEALAQFLDEAALQQEADNVLVADAINLLTLHAAKGLEFPVVCLVGLSEGVLPSKQYAQDEQGIAEERRLLYVGMTRAQEELHLVTNGERSRFLTEIGEDCLTWAELDEKKVSRIRRKEAKEAQGKLF